MTEFESTPDATDLLASTLRANSSDFVLFSDLLINKLTSILPSENVEVRRGKSLFGKGGQIEEITITFGDTNLVATKDRNGKVTFNRSKVVRGVTISRGQIDASEWLSQFADELSALAKKSTTSLEALNRFLAQ
ncbi:MAG: hypothetical protein M0019_01185 [Actinomycetota bacterium]|nr:hypothetical protein [Actinomycetota bacterium]